jgi:hypothetical protein
LTLVASFSYMSRDTALPFLAMHDYNFRHGDEILTFSFEGVGMAVTTLRGIDDNLVRILKCGAVEDLSIDGFLLLKG